MNTQQPMTDDELAAIRARKDAATPGQLVVEHDAGGEWNVFGPQSVIARDMGEDDAGLLANARADIDTLLAEVERLRTENASLRESLDLSDLIINSEALK